MDFEEIDLVIADDLVAGDVIRYQGLDYEVLSKEDKPGQVVLTVECQSSTDGDEEITLPWDRFVPLMGLTPANLED